MTNTPNSQQKAHPLKDQAMKLENTSQKIRFLSSKGESVKSIYNLLKVWGVTTKNGGEIRYQHVRNVVITPLTSKK